MELVIIDYGSGNLRSVEKACEKAASNFSKEIYVKISNSPNIIKNADFIILPGVGSYKDCCNNLKKIDNLWQEINEFAIAKQRPFLGICVGMQLMAEYGLEHGRTEGLGWFKGKVEIISPKDDKFKIPHMGWNELKWHKRAKQHPIFSGLTDKTINCYFANSYHFLASNQNNIIASTNYVVSINAIISQDNILGIQFHPEKSQTNGIEILTNFLKWRP